MRITFFEGIGLSVACLAAGYFTHDWIGGAALFVLWVIWKVLDTGEKLYILPLALTFQWTQSSLGVFYYGLTGRYSQTIDGSDYRTMVLIGLGCCLALAFGIALGMKLIKRPDLNEDRPGLAFSFPLLAAIYIVTVVLEGSMDTIVAAFPSLRQIIVTLDAARLGVLFLILRRFCQPKLQIPMLAAVVGFEVFLGITGFFAGFREPIVLTGIALLEIFDRRKLRHWMALGAMGVGAITLGILWMGIRGSYREDFVQIDNFQSSRQARASRLGGLSMDFFTSDRESIMESTDLFVERMWPVYYPALAVARVPEALPHTDGAMWMAAITHVITPRVLFPNKPELQSNSDLVRKYSNVMVAGRDQDTSIAFGYAAESYIDYGIPLMFLPIFGYAVVVGMSYSLFQKLIWHRELFVGFATASYWLTLYLFERDLPTTLGVALGFIVYVGVPTVLLDRFLLVRYARQRHDAEAPLFMTHSQQTHL